MNFRVLQTLKLNVNYVTHEFSKMISFKIEKEVFENVVDVFPTSLAWYVICLFLQHFCYVCVAQLVFDLYSSFFKTTSRVVQIHVHPCCFFHLSSILVVSYF